MSGWRFALGIEGSQSGVWAFDYLFLVIAWERRFADEHFEDKNAETPPIY